MNVTKEIRTIGSILMDVELITPKDIELALEQQKQTGKRFGEVLINLGIVSDDDIRWALAEQLNLPYVNIRKDQIDVNVAKLLPEKLARRYHVIPILNIDDELTVVVDDPLNTTIIKDIEAMTKCRVKISLGRTSDIVLAINEIYGTLPQETHYEQESPPRFVSSWFDDNDIQKILNDPSGQILLETILTTAFAHQVSQIYFQPGTGRSHISYRVNGLLQKQIHLGQEWYEIALFRLKLMSGFPVNKMSYPQYQEFSYRHFSAERAAELAVAIAVSLLPVVAGESAVMNVINRPFVPLWTPEREQTLPPFQRQELTAIHALQADLDYLKTGAVLCAGTAYFEKITTGYSLLNVCDPEKKSIITLESSSEYMNEKYYQIRYAKGKQLTDMGRTEGAEGAPTVGRAFPDSGNHAPCPPRIYPPEQGNLSAWLSALKTQTPDILFIDHIGSQVVLEQCLDFAARSCVLAAFDFKNVFEILAYLFDCQIPPVVITSRAYALLAQQPIRILCPECKQKEVSELSERMADTARSFSAKTPAGHIDIYAPKGCAACNLTGYADRLLLFELLRMASWLKECLHAHTPLENMERMAQEHGFVSLKQKCAELLLNGQTSIEETLSMLT